MKGRKLKSYQECWWFSGQDSVLLTQGKWVQSWSGSLYSTRCMAKKKKNSDNFMPQEITYKGKRNVKNTSIWRLNNIQLNNKWITEETKDERTFWRQMKIKTQ